MMNEKIKIIFWCLGISFIVSGFGLLLPIQGNLLGLTLQFIGILVLIVLSLIQSKHKRDYNET